ncbi:hypothetical protein CNECB9_1500018 [Cupriavidus necator]|uniref:Uncharacterized protein n=1 Tax=Cupriavidus necator TaxID=106590 RepID=A0A1K0IMM3_CUPNE|nr:hypothetical protein CNECB9_1500018 [Cupriavidus necator]
MPFFWFFRLVRVFAQLKAFVSFMKAVCNAIRFECVREIVSGWRLMHQDSGRGRTRTATLRGRTCGIGVG